MDELINASGRLADLAKVLEIAGVSGFEVDVRDGMTGSRSREYRTLHGLDTGVEEETHADWLARIHPEDRQRAEGVLLAALEGNAGQYENKYRIIRPSDGAVRWIKAVAFIERDETSRAIRLLGAHTDVTDEEQRRIEAEARQERDGFLLKLSDALRQLSDAAEIEATASRMLAEKLGVERAYYVEVMRDERRIRVLRDFAREGLASIAGEYPLDAFGWALQHYEAGMPLQIEDVTSSPMVPEAGRAAPAAGHLAWIAIPLMRQRQLAGALMVAQGEPRKWVDGEVALVEETAQRLLHTVERGRAEAALRESEERLRMFGEASSDILWIRDATSRQWTYLSPAFERIYGLSREAALRGDNFHTWLELINPADRDYARESFDKVAAGERLTFEYRVQRPDGGEHWVRDTDFPMRDAQGRVTRVGGIGHDATELKAALEHQRILLAELQHRVRNTLAVIRSIARRTAATSASVDDYAMNLHGRIDAFARVQAAVTRDPTAGVELATIVAEELRAASAREGEGVWVRGPSLRLSAKAAETIGLAVHELATNAIKYGALSVADARITVEWRIVEDDGRWLDFTWQETGTGPLEAPQHRGLGTEILIDTLHYELGGTTRLEYGAEGMRCSIRFPLQRISR